MVIFRGLGKDDSWKKPEAYKSRDTVPLRLWMCWQGHAWRPGTLVLHLWGAGELWSAGGLRSYMCWQGHAWRPGPLGLHLWGAGELWSAGGLRSYMCWQGHAWRPGPLVLHLWGAGELWSAGGRRQASPHLHPSHGSSRPLQSSGHVRNIHTLRSVNSNFVFF